MLGPVSDMDDLAIFCLHFQVQSVGILVDRELSFAPHLCRLSCDCYCQLRQLRTVAGLLTTNAATTLVHSMSLLGHGSTNGSYWSAG